MKKITIIILLILLPLLCWAGTLQDKLKAVVSSKNVTTCVSCTSGAKDQYYVTTNDSIAAGSSDYFFGQSFQVTSDNSHLYSIKVSVLGNYDGSVSLTLRYGNNIDLTTYWGTVTQSFTFVSTEEKEIEFVIQDTTNTLNTSTPYYFAISQNQAVGIKFHVSEASGYAGGTNYWTSDSGKWNLTGHQAAGDTSFSVYVCQ